MQIQLHGAAQFWQDGVRDDKRAELKNGAAWTEWMVCWCVVTEEVCRVTGRQQHHLSEQLGLQERAVPTPN